MDGESQNSRAYYNFQAGTAGSGGTDLDQDNANAPDTFCPLGWQLPYSGTGGDYYDQSKSWRYLFSLYGITDISENATQVKSYPFSFVPGGAYYWQFARFYYFTIEGDYMSKTVYNGWGMYRFGIGSATIRFANMVNKNYGLSLRCVSDFTKDASEKPIEPPQTLPAKSQA